MGCYTFTDAASISLKFIDKELTKHCLEYPLEWITYCVETDRYEIKFKSDKALSMFMFYTEPCRDDYTLELFFRNDEGREICNEVYVVNNPKLRYSKTIEVKKCNTDIMASIIDMLTSITSESKKSSCGYNGDDAKFDMPRIDQIWYNEPYTTIKWSDGSVTTSKCSENETFSKEVGFSMCISKKYLECRGFEYPRTAFKSLVDMGIDLKEIHDKRNRKKALKRAIDMAKAGYSTDEIKNTLNLTDDDVLDLFKDEPAKE